MTEESVKVPGRDDVALVQRAQQGEDGAFADLFNQLHQLVLNYVYHMLGDRQAAEDVTQDAFIRAHERIGQLGPPWDFKSWVFRIASNLAVDYLRRNRRFVDLEEPTMMAEGPITKRPSERGVQRNEARQAVWATLDGMPTTYRQALILREFNGQSYKEVSQALECTYDNARQLVHRARMRFRERHGLRLSLEAGVERCRELGDLLSAYHDGELDEQQRAAVEAHVKTCAQCRQTEEDLKKVGALIAGLVPLVPSPSWIAQVFDQLGIETVPSPAGGGQSASQVGSGASQGAGAGGMGGGGSFAGWMNSISGWGMMMKIGAFLMASAIVIGSIVLTSLITSPKPPSPLAAVPSESSDSEASDTSTPNPASESGDTEDSVSPTVSPTKEVTKTQTTTATLGPPMAKGNDNCNCRFGPAMGYDVVGHLNKDQSAPIDGRNADWTWWWIERQDGGVGHCWVSDHVVTVSGDTSAVPLIKSPPTSTPDDTTPPTVTINYSPTGYHRPDISDVVVFTAQAQDDGQIDRIEIWIRATRLNTFSKVATCQDSTSCSYSGGPYYSGYLHFFARAYDTAGNLGESAQQMVEIFSVVY